MLFTGIDGGLYFIFSGL